METRGWLMAGESLFLKNILSPVESGKKRATKIQSLLLFEAARPCWDSRS
jgi:hypothetical protein